MSHSKYSTQYILVICIHKAKGLSCVIQTRPGQGCLTIDSWSAWQLGSDMS